MVHAGGSLTHAPVNRLDFLFGRGRTVDHRHGHCTACGYGVADGQASGIRSTHGRDRRGGHVFGIAGRLAGLSAEDCPEISKQA